MAARLRKTNRLWEICRVSDPLMRLMAVMWRGQGRELAGLQAAGGQPACTAAAEFIGAYQELSLLYLLI